MAKPKRFTTEQFIQKLDKVIDSLITAKQIAPEIIQTDIQVNDIADKFEVNAATLRRWCQEHTGLNPRQYLAVYRIEQAKSWLRLGVRPSIISKRLAFTEHKNFSTLFKRLYGSSPSEFLIESV